MKVGDRVQVKEWNELEWLFGLDPDGDIDVHPAFTQDIKFLCGEFATVTEVSPTFICVEFERVFKDVDDEWIWNEDCFRYVG